jgi:tetratricopeptide (TPR) repeat protein
VSRLHQISGCEQADRKADVVFIHGLGGDAFTTWRHAEDESTSWPHWLGEEFPEVGVWSLGYAASPTKWSRMRALLSSGQRDAGYGMALPDRALQVLDLMVQRGLGERPLFLICHSLGGLVAKQILRTSSDAFDPRMKRIFACTRAVMFLSTPHAGAGLASMADAFRTVFGATVTIQDLRAHDAHLRNLHNWYRNHSADAHIQTACYFELRGYKGVTIVNPTSAHPSVGTDPVGLDEDHISIAKPRERDAQVCGAARDLLRNLVLAPGAPASLPMVTVNIDAAAPGHAGRVLIPHELPPAAEEFYGRQTEIERLIARLQARKNTAVVGPAGLGKTALAAKALFVVVGDTPAALAASPFPDGVVFLDLYTFRGQAERAWDALANKLAGAAFMERSTARARAAEACRARSILVVLEGGEEADGMDGRSSIDELLGVFSPQNRWLLLTRLSTQVEAARSIVLSEALPHEDAERLLGALTQDRLTPALRERALTLLEGHPLALTWAGNLIARDDDDPEWLMTDWVAAGLPRLSDPQKAGHTLQWLFNRSVRGLDDAGRQVLAAAALLAHAPFPFAAVSAALCESGQSGLLSDWQAGRDTLRSLVQRGLLQRSREADHWQFAHVLGYRFARKETGSDPVIRVRLGRWLDRRLASALATDGDQSLTLTRALEHVLALSRTDGDQSLWNPLVSSTLYEVTDRLNDLGRLSLVRIALTAVANWLELLPAEKAQEAEWLHECAVLQNRQGHVLRDQGDLAGALEAYGKSLEVSRKLAGIDPSNVYREHDLSVSRDNLGHVLRARGDLAGALEAYGKSLEVSRRLAEADPSNAAWQRDLSVSHDNIGHVLRDQGDLEGALQAFRKSLEVMRKLAEADPSNADCRLDLSMSQENVGHVLRDQGDLAGALETYGKSLEVRRALAEADPSNADWQWNLSASQSNVGHVLRAQGNLAGALEAFGKSLELMGKLAEADPSNASCQRDLSVCQENAGHVLRAQGDLSGALEAFRKSLEMRGRLAGADPSNAGWQRDLSVSLDNAGDVLRNHGDLTGALEAFRKSLEVMRKLADADPSNAGWQWRLSVSQSKVGDVLSDQGDLTGALEAYGKSLEIMQSLTEADSSNAGWQRDLSVSQENAGDVLRKQGDLTGALEAYGKSLEVMRRLTGADPSNAGWQRDLSRNQNNVGHVLRAQGDLEGALREFGKSLEIRRRLAGADPSNADWQRDLAYTLARMAELKEQRAARLLGSRKKA